MNEHYELYDGMSYNLIADAVTEGEILAILRNTVEERGESSVHGLILMREDGRYAADSKALIAADEDLVRLAFASSPHATSGR
ncbi:MAG: hypothetical protein M3Y58_12490 [Chloroflexota bacterium]|nr:hypothetical protein [Chloroflexota bacterium]